MSVPLTLLMGATGIAIGYFLKKDKPMAPMFISAVLVFLGGILLIYAASVLITDVNYIEESMNMAEESLENTIGIMDSFGQAPTEQVKKRMYESIDMMNTLMPSLFVLMSVIMVLLIFFAAHPIVKRFSDKALKWPHFRDLRLPKSLFMVLFNYDASCSFCEYGQEQFCIYGHNEPIFHTAVLHFITRIFPDILYRSC